MLKHSDMNGSVGAYGFALAYCFLNAASLVYIQYVNHSVSPLLSEVVIFLITTFYFGAWNVRHLPTMVQKSWQYKKRFMLINLWTTLIWLGTFFALTEISPVLCIVEFMGLSPLLTFLFSLARRQQTFSLTPLIFGGVILLLILALLWVSLQNLSVQAMHQQLLGSLYNFIAALGGALYFLDSKAFQDETKLSTSQVLALRFLLLIGVCFIFSWYQGALHMMSTLPYEKLVLMALLSSILPLYCMQVALRRLGAVQLSFITPFSPIFAYLLVLSLGQKMPWTVLPLLIALSVTLIIYSRFKVNVHKPSHFHPLRNALSCLAAFKNGGYHQI